MVQMRFVLQGFMCQKFDLKGLILVIVMESYGDRAYCEALGYMRGSLEYLCNSNSKGLMIKKYILIKVRLVPS